MNRQQKEELDAAKRSYECGKEFKSRIGLYERAAENERFYRGDQWSSVDSEGLPTPVFNLIRRISSYLVSSVMSYSMSVVYDDALLACRDDSGAKRRAYANLDSLSKAVADRWERLGMEKIFRDALTDAVITGDGIIYCWFDSDSGAGAGISAETVDNTEFFAADMNSSDIQSQDYIMLAGRSPVSKLRREAASHGLPDAEISMIIADGDGGYGQDICENGDEEADKATYLIKFSRDENGYVRFIKCTEKVIIADERTNLRYYPVAFFNWEPTKHCLHGSSPISEMIGNQKYVNKAFAMEMKHMVDTAFSKVIYDKRLIPEWSNEVGEAIGVMSGGDVSGAVATVGTGQMQDGYIEIIDRVITYTKELEGATEAALGEVDPTNTSAILALRESSDLPLERVRSNFYSAVGSLALIFADMMKEYLPGFVRYLSSGGEIGNVDLGSLDMRSLSAKVETGPSRRFSSSLMLSTLGSLLEGGHITFDEYLEFLPDGVIKGKERLMRKSGGRSDTESKPKGEMTNG